MNRLSRLYFRFWRPVGVVVVIALLSYILYFHNLAHFLPGYAPGEVHTYMSAHSFNAILNQPLNAPYKIVVRSLAALGHHSLLATRLVAAIFAVGASLLFFIVAHYWFSYRIAFFATIMFTTSSGFLHIARLGSPLVLQMGLLLLLTTAIWWNSGKRGNIMIFTTILACAALWYVPGMIWFELLAAIILRKKLLRGFQLVSRPKQILGVVFFLLLITPLVRAAVLTPSILLTFAGLPSHFISPLQTLKNIGNSLLSVGVHSNGGADLWLAHVPLLDSIEIVLLLLGIYTFVRRQASARGLYLLAATLLSLLLIGLHGPVGISSLLPLLYLVIAAGLYELLEQWRVVFPRNPFARFAGVFFIFILVFFSATYQYRAYIVAWPNNTATRQTFHLQQQAVQ